MSSPSPRLPFHLIESFLAVSEESSLQAAAERIGLTQSALSRHMQSLESFLPHKVFALSGRKKVLTTYGKTLYDLLQPTFAQTQELIDQASLAFAKEANATVKISGRGELLDLIATQLAFEGRLHFLNMDNDEAVQSVLERHCELAIVHSAPDSHDLMLRPFFSNRFKIVVARSLLKSKPGSKTEWVAKLKSLPCLLYKAKDPVADNVFADWGITVSALKISRIYSNYSSLLKMAEAGLGWAIIPSHYAVSETQNHIFELPARSQDERRFFLCFRPELKTVPWFKELLTGLKALAAKTST